MTLAPGTTLAAYTIERLLGRGGMGEVYLATHAGLGRKVALKLLAPELAADPHIRERFIAESRLAASLDHPHIIPIYEAGEADERLFLAMRYVEGDDLGRLIERDGRLPPDRAVGLLNGIAAALDAAHDRGLVHRDVKPGNILVSRDARGEEHAYLADFGLVKQLGSDAGFSRSGQLVGSVDYVAPEQIEGRPIDGRVDVYSLACVLYACLTGQPPYSRETEVATLWAHVQADPPRVSDLTSELPRFDPVIARGMAKDRGERFATAGELVGDAREALPLREAEPVAGFRPVGVTTPSAAPQAVNPAPIASESRRSSGRLVLLGSLAAAGVAAVAVVASLGLGGPVANASPSPRSLSPAATPSAAAPSSSVPASPDGLSGPSAELLARLPPSIQPTCAASSAADGGLGGLASLRCELISADADTLWYDQFNARGQMTDQFDRIVAAAGVRPADCGAGVESGVGEWRFGSTYGGRMLCYQENGKSWLVWTHDSERIVVQATRGDEDFAALYAWWRGVGPYLR